MQSIGKPASFWRASTSPDEQYLLINLIVPLFAHMMPVGRFTPNSEGWGANPDDTVYIAAEIRLQDTIPIAFYDVDEGPRGIGWQSDAGSSFYWAQ